MEKGGRFGLKKIAFFNGGLFDGRQLCDWNQATSDLLIAAASLDWSQIDPTIFGTLFERFLDPDKRAQIGAHYTDPDKIMMIVEPVILRPLRAEWELVKAEITPLAERASGIVPQSQSPGDRRAADVASANSDLKLQNYVINSWIDWPMYAFSIQHVDLETFSTSHFKVSKTLKIESCWNVRPWIFRPKP